MRKLLLSLLCLCTFNAYAQLYPKWFLNPGELSCPMTHTTVVRSSIYPQSAIQTAFSNGCVTLAKYKNVSIKGGQAMWSTEGGTYALGYKYTEVFDSSLSETYREKLKIIDSFNDRKNIFVLMGDSSCSFDSSSLQRVNIAKIPAPKWVEVLPGNAGELFGIGVSQEFQFEASSWSLAEKNAVMSLARSIKVEMKSLLKQNEKEHQDLRDESLDAVLRDIKIVARWMDGKRKIYYVLAKSKK
jgi:hypothetical protein